jgi:hypothetical protein
MKQLRTTLINPKTSRDRLNAIVVARMERERGIDWRAES